MNTSPGGRIARVQSGSLAEAAGLCRGDAVVSINGHLLRDVIDYHFYAAEEELDVVAGRGEDELLTVHIARGYDQDLGLEFERPTFDGIRRCRNKCDLCFIHQMPPGLRRSLYIKDDDYRYSFLSGNFVTLTNLEEEDWTRIGEQRLSPLYVSVHATDPELRSRILGVQATPDILPQLRRLGDLGIEVHTQVVVIPEVNDGQALERTVLDLAELYPTVASIALVPVGITRYQACGLRTLTPQEAEAVLALARPLQRQHRKRCGIALVYPSDEMYLMAGQPLPSARAYDGFPQLANGVGMVRQFLDDWRSAKQRRAQGTWPYERTTLVCGTLIAPLLRQLVDEWAQSMHADVQVLPVENALFGPTVTVSGLLAAQDVLRALQGRDLGQLVVLPRAMFDAAGEVTLDDQSLREVEQTLGVPVAVAEKLSELLQTGAR
jgi:putative radical SAM enzyme (TIGR03279 family)